MVRRFIWIMVAILALVPVAANARPHDMGPSDTPAISDPLERFNRAVFQFNRGVDFLVLNPLAMAYTHILPGFARTSIGAFLSNLSSPIYAANELLQADWADFDVTVRRFVVNSTLGVAGLVDVAAHHGLTAPEPEDFGQTLAMWGVGHGPYFVAPLMGPTSLRDAFAGIVDIFFDPFNMMFDNSDDYELIYARLGLTVVDARAKIGPSYDDIMNNAVDPYVTFRSIYVQNRAYLVKESAVDSYDDLEGSE